MQKDTSGLTIDIQNTKPVELISLGISFAAFSEEFRDFAKSSPSDMRLYVQELRSGSVIAHLVAISEQIDWMLKHAEIYGAFVTNLNDLVNFFLGKPHNLEEKPTQKQAKNISKIVDPVAQDGGSQLNIIVADGGVANIHLNSIDANAIQNAVGRYIGPQIPSSQMFVDQLLQLEQVKNDVKKQGDRGIITDISDRPIKLIFASEETKNAVLGVEENPFKCLFLVDLEVKSHQGRPTVYKIYSVKSVIRD